MRNALIIFTKVPKAGETKTRLTEARGGILTPEEAKEFYESSLLDVIDACIASGSGDIYICYNIHGDSDYLKKMLQATSNPGAIKGIFPDEGSTFDNGMQYAFDYIFKDGGESRLADSAIIIGGDAPSIQPLAIKAAADKLEKLSRGPMAMACAKRTANTVPEIGGAMIESIDQEGGFNLIGVTYTAPFRFDGVFYNMSGVTALDMIAFKAAELRLPISIVEMIPDVDLPTDLASLIPILNTLQLAEQYDPEIIAPKRTIRYLEELGLQAVATVPK
ncbi:DUF2064 domain-containing protein [Dehalobacter sp. DCM]|uniref:TIGR04282 family arsenosugar biosynthesis glycosyltransferase n=1 Tax=Dehalobacter sp. DCM TaxID=2907827 RepID=UPI003081BC85|nr:DUF2064 domain-containing protein [Dehalobacter sp. DCM]